MFFFLIYTIFIVYVYLKHKAPESTANIHINITVMYINLDDNIIIAFYQSFVKDNNNFPSAKITFQY